MNVTYEPSAIIALVAGVAFLGGFIVGLLVVGKLSCQLDDKRVKLGVMQVDGVVFRLKEVKGEP